LAPLVVPVCGRALAANFCRATAASFCARRRKPRSVIYIGRSFLVVACFESMWPISAGIQLLGTGRKRPLAISKQAND
jgi:hypothetical protein